MLFISREKNESIILNTPDGVVKVTIKAIKSAGQVKLSIDAPDLVEIVREELITVQGC